MRKNRFRPMLVALAVVVSASYAHAVGMGRAGHETMSAPETMPVAPASPDALAFPVGDPSVAMAPAAAGEAASLSPEQKHQLALLPIRDNLKKAIEGISREDSADGLKTAFTARIVDDRVELAYFGRDDKDFEAVNRWAATILSKTELDKVTYRQLNNKSVMKK